MQIYEFIRYAYANYAHFTELVTHTPRGREYHGRNCAAHIHQSGLLTRLK